MTEQEWLAESYQPGEMVEQFRGKVSPRKMRLFAVACCRRAAHLLPEDARYLQAIEAAELYADREIQRAELVRAHAAALEAAQACSGPGGIPNRSLAALPASSAAHAVCVAADPTSRSYASRVTHLAAMAFVRAGLPSADSWEMVAQGGPLHPFWEPVHAESKVQCHLVRDIFGNPFRPLPDIDASVLKWNGGTVKTIARAIYQDRSFEQLPVLADALEEAGWTGVEVLDHLRGPGPHVRGCWVIDWVLGRGARS